MKTLLLILFVVGISQAAPTPTPTEVPGFPGSIPKPTSTPTKK